MALIVLDASVVIALVSAADALHAQAREFLAEHPDDDFRIPASAYAELLVGPARSGRIDEIREGLASAGFSIEPITAEIAERAAALRAHSGRLGLGDAMVLATADALRADEVVTGDRGWRRFDRVRLL